LAVITLPLLADCWNFGGIAMEEKTSAFRSGGKGTIKHYPVLKTMSLVNLMVMDLETGG